MLLFVPDGRNLSESSFNGRDANATALRNRDDVSDGRNTLGNLPLQSTTQHCSSDWSNVYMTLWQQITKQFGRHQLPPASISEHLRIKDARLWDQIKGQGPLELYKRIPFCTSNFGLLHHVCTPIRSNQGPRSSGAVQEASVLHL